MSDLTTRQLLGVIGTFYDAGLGTESWEHALNMLAAAFGAVSANLALLWGDPSKAQKVVSVGVDSGAVDTYERRYGLLNPVSAAIPRLPVGAPFTDGMVSPRDVTLRGEFYNDWARPNGLEQGLFAVLVRDGVVNGSICISRSSREGDFDGDQLDLLSLLAPHLQRATQADICLADAIKAAGVVAALNNLREGVVLVAADGIVLYANSTAEAMIAEADGLSIERGKLRAATAARTTMLRQTLARTTAVVADALVIPTTGSMESVLRLERPSGRRPLAMLIVPLTHRTAQVWAAALPAARAVVFVIDPERRETEVQPRTLRRLYGLTLREAMLAIEVSRGDGLRAAADRLGIASATARTHLLRVFAKTDTRRQADLVRLVGSVGREPQD
jgi:DNA-binding CsgD family transcriptional regulator